MRTRRAVIQKGAASLAPLQGIRRRLPLGRFLVPLAALLAVGCTLLLAGWGSASASPSPPSGNPTAEGRLLVHQFFTLLHNGDTKGLNALLAPSFQAVRANGDVQNKASYLADPPKVGRFTIAKLKGSQSGGVLVLSYQVTVTETISNTAQPTGPAPRLSVFQWQNGAWRLAAHSNFGAITK